MIALTCYAYVRYNDLTEKQLGVFLNVTVFFNVSYKCNFLSETDPMQWVSD